MIETRNGSDEVIKQHVWGTQYIDESIQIGINTNPGEDDDGGEAGMQDNCDTFYWTAQDANYNVLGLFNSDGDLVERYEYTPYGQRTVFRSPGSDDTLAMAPTLESRRVEVGGVAQPYGLCDIGHQGLIHDKEFGLIYNRRRYLEPVLGIYTGPDPKRYVDGMNYFEDRRSNPVGFLDPMGLRIRAHNSYVQQVRARWERQGIGHRKVDRIQENPNIKIWTQHHIYWVPTKGDSVLDSSYRVISPCTVIVQLSHYNVPKLNPFRASSDTLSAFGYLTCWGDHHNRIAHRKSMSALDEPDHGGIKNEPTPGVIEGFARIQSRIGDASGVAAKGEAKETAARRRAGIPQKDDELYGLNSAKRAYNGGLGPSLSQFFKLVDAAMASARAQAKKFAKDCRCLCDKVEVRFTYMPNLLELISQRVRHTAKARIDQIKNRTFFAPCEKNRASGKKHRKVTPSPTTSPKQTDHPRGLGW